MDGGVPRWVVLAVELCTLFAGRAVIATILPAAALCGAVGGSAGRQAQRCSRQIAKHAARQTHMEAKREEMAGPWGSSRS